jgi:hypothetical protein
MATGELMSVKIPGKPSMFNMPKALHDRLHELLDRQDRDGKLTARERREAEALVELSHTLSLLKMSARRVQPSRGT